MGYILRIQEIIRCDMEKCTNEYVGPEINKPQDWIFPDGKPPDWHDLGEIGLVCQDCYDAIVASMGGELPKKKKYQL